jgi:hypothetical protein
MNAPFTATTLMPSAQADYDAWLVQQVQEARDDTRPRISHEEVLRRSAIRREALLAQRELAEA